MRRRVRLAELGGAHADVLEETIDCDAPRNGGAGAAVAETAAKPAAGLSGSGAAAGAGVGEARGRVVPSIKNKTKK